MNLPRSFRATSLLPLFLLLSVPLAAAEPQRLAPLYADAAPVMAWEKLREVKLPDTVITSVRMEPAENAVLVTAVVSHPPASDRVTVWVAFYVHVSHTSSTLSSSVSPEPKVVGANSSVSTTFVRSTLPVFFTVIV